MLNVFHIFIGPCTSSRKHLFISVAHLWVSFLSLIFVNSLYTLEVRSLPKEEDATPARGHVHRKGTDDC